jgi:putative inorganic carbon (HCO3(-)) transporter
VRELALIAVLVMLCILSLVAPRIGILVYVWFATARPDVFAYSHKPLFFFVALAVGLGSLRLIPQYPNVVRSWISRLLVLMQIPVAFSIIMAVVPALCMIPYSFYIKVVLMSLLIPIVVVDETMMRRFLLVFALSLGFVAAKFAVWGILRGGATMTSGYGGMIGDNNGLALAMVMLVPMAWHSRELVRSWILKTVLLGITACAAATIIMTGSRGNSLALVVVVMALVLRSRQKTMALITMGLLVIPILALVGERYYERMATLRDVSADASASSRLEFARAAFHMWQDYPVFGVGFGQQNYRLLATNYLTRTSTQSLVVHNTYLQTLVDSGIVALGLFLVLLFGSIWSLGRSARRIKPLRPDLVCCPRALQVSLIGFAVGCTFYSRPDFEIFYIVLGGAAAWQLIARQILADSAAPPPTAAPVPVYSLQSPPWLPSNV